LAGDIILPVEVSHIPLHAFRVYVHIDGKKKGLARPAVSLPAMKETGKEGCGRGGTEKGKPLIPKILCILRLPRPECGKPDFI
jgi:hypothetical protein